MLLYAVASSRRLRVFPLAASVRRLRVSDDASAHRLLLCHVLLPSKLLCAEDCSTPITYVRQFLISDDCFCVWSNRNQSSSTSFRAHIGPVRRPSSRAECLVADHCSESVTVLDVDACIVTSAGRYAQSNTALNRSPSSHAFFWTSGYCLVLSRIPTQWRTLLRCDSQADRITRRPSASAIEQNAVARASRRARAARSRSKQVISGVPHAQAPHPIDDDAMCNANLPWLAYD